MAYVYDDYAHHPTEIAATLSAAKSLKNKVEEIKSKLQLAI